MTKTIETVYDSGVEIAAGYRLKPIQFMKQPAVLIFRYKKKADSISH